LRVIAVATLGFCAHAEPIEWFATRATMAKLVAARAKRNRLIRFDIVRVPLL